MECQRIEHDVKLIYAGMLKGDFMENFHAIKRLALGEIIIELEKLDNSDQKPYFSNGDYVLLKDIKNVRNWLVHRAYKDFMYQKQSDWEESFKKSNEKLVAFSKRVKNLGNQVENVRLDVLKRYGRI